MTVFTFYKIQSEFSRTLMTIIKPCAIYVLLLSWSLSSFSQSESLAIGQWRIHLPFNKLHSVAEGNGVVYCAGKDGMFIYNKDDGAISLLTRMEGLSDFSISHIRYNHEYNVLMVVYENSNIDLIYNDKSIVNISDLLRANIIGNKDIHHIDFNGRYAYLSCGFGIVVIDLPKREVKDTYYIGPNGNPIIVYGSVLYGNEIFAATENGIYRADKNNPFLSLYSSWTKDTTLPDPNKRYSFLTLFGNNLITVNDSIVNFNSLMLYDGTSWSNFLSNDNTVRSRVEFFENHLTVVNSYSISAYNTSGTRTHYIDQSAYTSCCDRTSNPQDGFVDSNNIFWIADGSNGLTRNIQNPETHLLIYPNGPGASGVYAMASKNNRLWVAGGLISSNIFSNTYSKDGAYLYSNNQWKSYNKTTDPPLNAINFFDFITVAIDPDNADHAFIGSWGEGVFEFTTEGVQTIYDENNSSLGAYPNTDIVRVGGLSFDSKKNLWVSNTTSSSPISVKKPDGTWQSYSLSVLQNTIPQAILCDSRDRKWILLPWTGGLVVFDENNTFLNSPDLHARIFTTANGNGKLPSLNVQCITEDNDGQIWIGTEKGVAVLYSPDNVYSGNYDFSQVKLLQDGNYQFLLETEMVTAVAVDGANRKWFGTESSGVFLMSADGTQQVQHFTTDNSPLLSNTIFSIAIDHKTGEVFIGTEKGIVSYKSDAIEGGQEFDDVYAFPNPVRPGYSGPIAIRGLLANANVKITDISGALVYETKSNGGLAIWNGNNFTGERAQSGVYLIFCANDDGSKTFVTKLLFMH